MRLIGFPTVASLALLTLAGCGTGLPLPETPKLAFCDAEEARVFTQEEIDARAARWPENLRRDFKTNTTGGRECGWFEK